MIAVVGTIKFGSTQVVLHPDEQLSPRLVGEAISGLGIVDGTRIASIKGDVLTLTHPCEFRLVGRKGRAVALGIGQ